MPHVMHIGENCEKKGLEDWFNLRSIGAVVAKVISGTQSGGGFGGGLDSCRLGSRSSCKMVFEEVEELSKMILVQVKSSSSGGSDEMA